jgi:glycerophosphoryl diester phosphodiesterase
MPALFASKGRPLLFAHRGASRQAPENTLEAFDLAARLGADVLEMDVHLSADGEIMVMHDARLERTTNGTGFLRDHTCAALQQLDAGANFLTSDGAPRFRDRGLTIPRFEDVLRAFPKVAFNVEIKQAAPSMVRQVLALLERVGPRDVLLTAADHAIMMELEAQAPGCPLGLSAQQAWAVVRGSYVGGIPPVYRGRALQIPPRHRGLPVATGRVLKAARAAGVEVHLWTINAPRDAAAWLARGVDGLMSDDPGGLGPVFDTVRGATAPRAARSNP